MEPYLIQRGTIENNESKKGVDSIISFDYMGSAEFEFGALPKSLGNIRSAINNYVYLDVPIKNKVISVFCKESQKSSVREYLSDLAKNKIRLKEFSAFNNYINDEGYFKNKFNFWWDILNDLMFWVKDSDFELKFKTTIAVKPN